MLRVVLISDQRIVHDALKRFILPLMEFEVECACYISVAEALHTEKAPDLILLEYSLNEETTGPEYVPVIRKVLPNAKIVGYSVFESAMLMFVRCGADGFISKFDHASQIADQIAKHLVKEDSP